MWQNSSYTKLAAADLIEVIETGIHQAVHEIVIVDVDIDYPLLPTTDPQYARRMYDRKRVEIQNRSNMQRVKRVIQTAIW